MFLLLASEGPALIEEAVCDLLPYGLEGPPAQRQVVPATAGVAPFSSPSWLSL